MTFDEAGLVTVALDEVEIEVAATLSAYSERLTHRAISPLARLSENEMSAGLARLEADAAADRLEHQGWVQRIGAWLCWSAEPAVRRWAGGADVVVSTYPLASQTLGRLRQSGQLAVPAVTYLTDPAAPRLWCHVAVDEHLTVTQATADDGARYGVELRTAGTLCAPRLSRAVPRAVRLRLRSRCLPRHRWYSTALARWGWG